MMGDRFAIIIGACLLLGFCVAESTKSAHADTTCWGFLGLYMKCTDDAVPVISNFCDRAKQLKNLRFTEQEATSLSDENVQKLTDLRRKYKRHCPDGQRVQPK